MHRMRRLRILGCVLLSGILLACCSFVHPQIVAFGASNISGWNVAASEAMPAQLQQMLRAKGYSVKVLNAGIYGNTTTEMRSRLDADIPDGTQIVLLDTSGGEYNNNRKGIGREQGAADMDAIRARLKIRGIAVLPVSAADLPAEYHQQDGVHLTPEGHRLLASQLLPKIVDILGPPPEAASIPASARKACYADAKRLCESVLGDEAKRHECMQEHKAQLSKDCRDALAASRQH